MPNAVTVAEIWNCIWIGIKKNLRSPNPRGQSRHDYRSNFYHDKRSVRWMWRALGLWGYRGNVVIVGAWFCWGRDINSMNAVLVLLRRVGTSPGNKTIWDTLFNSTIIYNYAMWALCLNLGIRISSASFSWIGRNISIPISSKESSNSVVSSVSRHSRGQWIGEAAVPERTYDCYFVAKARDGTLPCRILRASIDRSRMTHKMNRSRILHETSIEIPMST